MMLKGCLNSNNDGMVLASVLIVLGVVVAMVIHFQLIAGHTLKYAERRLAGAILKAAATDAAWDALRRLATDSGTPITHTNESWAKPFYALLPNGVEVFAVVTDEQRFFDVNNFSVPLRDPTTRAVSEIVAELLESGGCHEPEVLTSVLYVWFNEDNVVLPSDSTRGDRLVESSAEFVRVLDDVSTTCIRFLSVLPYKRSRVLPVNVNTAEPDVLQAVFGGNDSVLTEAVCRLRDAQPVLSLSQLVDVVGQDRLRAVSLYLDVKSSFFSVRARAVKGDFLQEVYALVHKDDEGNIQVIRWGCK